MTAREILEEKALDYELNALAISDRPGADSRAVAVAYAVVAIALREVAAALDVEEREAA